MQLLNATRMQAGYTMGMRPDGRELLVVVVKGTFTFPHGAEEPQLAEEQLPIVEADTFTGEPGLSAPIYESDYAPVKPRCDVLLLGSAYAPYGRPTERVRVSLRVGQMHKQFDVVGNRAWRSDVFGVTATSPEPFTVMPLSYDTAFGGVDNLNADPAKHDAFLANPIGRGFYPISTEQIEGKPLPNTEEQGYPITNPKGPYNPMGFGPIGRHWQPRPQYAGTYDQNWIDNIFPFLPPDFDDRYYQCAPLDQQIDYLRGGEEVELVNLTPEGRTAFLMPILKLPVTFYYKNRVEREADGLCDTLLLEPDLRRFTMVWRTSIPLRQNIFEIVRVLAGRMSWGWYRAQGCGKSYYPSLKELVAAKRAELAIATQEEPNGGRGT